MSEPLRFGYHLPVWGPAAGRDALVTMARRVEALGFDSVWASDHLVMTGVDDMTTLLDRFTNEVRAKL